MNELVIANHEIQVQEGRFELIGYEDLVKQVDELGKYLTTIEVTPENVKDNKKLVAQVRKMTDNLNRERIEFKKQYLRPVTYLEGQVKELTEKVKKYESVVRVQIRELEEKERQEKEDEIHTLFLRRQRAYGSDGLYPFRDFIKPEYLNKSTPMSKIETAMTDWFEGRASDIRILTDYAETNVFDVTEVIGFYLATQSLNTTLEQYNTTLRNRATLEEALDENSRKDKRQKKAVNADKNAGSPEDESYILIAVKASDKEKAEKVLTKYGIEFSFPNVGF